MVWTGCALAAGPAVAETQQQPLNIPAIVMFLVFVAMTLVITYWAAKRTKTASDYYAAGGGITGTQNGLAIAGDYMSAATLLGITGLVYSKGFDGFIYCIAFFACWPIIMFLMAERLRNLGKFTFADITSYRLDQRKVRTMAAIGSLAVVIFYLIAQMVGAGQLIKLLFGLPYWMAVVVVGVMMVIYVTFGGMLATTWVQIIKACLLLGGGTVVMLLAMSQFGFNFETLATDGGVAAQGRRQDHGPRQHAGGPGHGGVAGDRPHVRHRGAAAHPDAVLHRAGCQAGAQERVRRDLLRRFLLLRRRA